MTDLEEPPAPHYNSRLQRPLLFLLLLYCYLLAVPYVVESGGAVGYGTALQAGRSRVRFPMVLLERFIVIIL